MKTIYILILSLCSFSSIAQSLNKYDGVYLVKSYTFRSGDPARTGYPLPFEMNLVTTSPESVQFDTLHLWADGTGVGIGDVIFIVDSITNIVTPSATGTSFVVPVAGFLNTYNPVTKTFLVTYTWGNGPTSRLINDTLIYLRARTILPLTLISFKANVSGLQTHLTWTTVNEVAVKSYNIERSSDGRLYTTLGIVDAVNKPEANYSFNDKPASKGINYYYRLKMIDNNGSYKYSNVATVNYHTDSNVEIYPNPATNNIVLKHAKAITGATITITDAEGKQIKMMTVQPDAVQTKISVDKLGKGNYIITYQNNSEKSVIEFVKQ